MELWTYEHAVTLIPAVAVMVLLTLLLRRWLKDKPYKVRMIPFQIIAAILLIIEAGKQILSLRRGYDLYHLPFHFCSLFIFMIPAMAFYSGKYRATVRAITAALCGSVFSLMLIYPELIYSKWNVLNYFEDFFSFHTVTFHNLVMLAFLLIPALQLHKPHPKGEVKAVIWFVIGFCAVSASMAYLLKTNFAGFYTCNIPVLETVRLAIEASLGRLPAIILYISILTVVNIVYVYGAYWLYRLLEKLFNKQEKTTLV